MPRNKNVRKFFKLKKEREIKKIFLNPSLLNCVLL